MAAAPKARTQGPGVYRYKLGDIQLTALYDGLWSLKIDDEFVRNASGAAVNKRAGRGVPAAQRPAGLVHRAAGQHRIEARPDRRRHRRPGRRHRRRHDGQPRRRRRSRPTAIDTIVISHFHPDHIDGLKTKDGDKVFANAEILVPEPEWTYWMDDAEMNKAPDRIKVYFRNARRIFGDIGKEVRRFKPGAEVAPGITSIPAFGHTPGHCAFAIASRNQSMLVMSDAVRNPYLFARHPEWQPLFDMDGPLAVKTRKQMLDRAAADRMLVEAYHFPFPACGHIARSGKGYELVPVEWQPL